MARLSHKLSNSWEGALAGGGDPATSPLYVFGPFLKLIVVAGVAQITFGASIWLVVLTIAVVSAMYRLVMQWVTDGSGGSGLSEDEFGGWAVKVNAAITFIEYTLTFLVSMAAMVTFIADRIPALNDKILWIQYRAFVAIGLSIFTGWLVNRGPKMAARTFGPATGGVLLLLWIMIITTVFKMGFHLPSFNLSAFNAQNLNFTLSGYARILAVMTGIEVFANLVAAYEGKPEEKSKKAFNSLLIIMGTTALTMVIVGPAIYQLSNPSLPGVSVFTQTMDRLLPDPLPYLGTIVGIAVLMSASAASAQGLQNLSLGLFQRHYVPYWLGQRNVFEVADKPVWIEVLIVSVCFFFFGTQEDTYLAIYAAGVFILLSMTGWAVTKRLLRQNRGQFSITNLVLIGGSSLAAFLTSAATGIIFGERFLEGAWTYFLFIPFLYLTFSYFRNRLGEPTQEADYLGQLDAAQLAGFGFGQYPSLESGVGNGAESPSEITWQPEPIEQSNWREQKVSIRRLVVLLDGSSFAAQAIPLAKAIGQATSARLTLFSAIDNEYQVEDEKYKQIQVERQEYLQNLVEELESSGLVADHIVSSGSTVDAAEALVADGGVDLLITTTRGKSGVPHWLSGGVSSKLVQRINKPVLLVKSIDQKTSKTPMIKRILVALDGSIYSERALPYARALAQAFRSELVLISVPEVPRMKDYRAAAEIVDTLRIKADTNMRKFLQAVARSLRNEGIKVRTIVTGSIPARTIISIGKKHDTDLIMMTSHGRGGLELFMVGSVAQRVVQSTQTPVFIVPILPQ